LLEDIEECKLRLSRAIKLVAGLADEKKRWAHDVEILK
jgi:hypothetical protein